MPTGVGLKVSVSLGSYNTLDHLVHTLKRALRGVIGTKTIQVHLGRPGGRNVSSAFFICLH